jgi:hypothetical protein
MAHKRLPWFGVAWKERFMKDLQTQVDLIVPYHFSRGQFALALNFLLLQRASGTYQEDLLGVFTRLYQDMSLWDDPGINPSGTFYMTFRIPEDFAIEPVEQALVSYLEPAQQQASDPAYLATVHILAIILDAWRRETGGERLEGEPATVSVPDHLWQIFNDNHVKQYMAARLAQKTTNTFNAQDLALVTAHHYSVTLANGAPPQRFIEYAQVVLTENQ